MATPTAKEVFNAIFTQVETSFTPDVLTGPPVVGRGELAFPSVAVQITNAGRRRTPQEIPRLGSGNLQGRQINLAVSIFAANEIALVELVEECFSFQESVNRVEAGDDDVEVLVSTGDVTRVANNDLETDLDYVVTFDVSLMYQ